MPEQAGCLPLLHSHALTRHLYVANVPEMGQFVGARVRGASTVIGRTGVLPRGAEREYDTPHPNRNLRTDTGVIGPASASGEAGKAIIREGDVAMEEGKTAGIDVGKASLDVWAGSGPVQRFDNTQEGITTLMEWLGDQGVVLAVCEPTGGYERQLVSGLREAGIGMRQAHPNRVRAFARACGYEAKTDDLDALVLCRFGQAFALEQSPQGEVEPERAELRELLRRRRQLVEQRVQELNRLDKGLSEGARASTQRHIHWLDQEIARLDRGYQRALNSSLELSQQAELYRSVRGIGKLTAAVLVADLPELGQGDAKGLASLVGLAPWSRDSGRQRGYRAIRGGRGSVRRALYLAALSVVRCQDSTIGRFYRQLRQRGKPGKVAMVAVMRKLLLQLHAVARRGTPWVENYAPAT